MEIIYVLFFAAIGIVIAIGVGLEISKGIDEFMIYMLFWMLYIITIITFINVVLVGNYYLNMKDKQGPPGQQGLRGEIGNKGDTGLCDPNCRDSIAENSLNEMILNELKERSSGVAVKMNNVYIKSKIRQMCSSDEFKQLAPYNGPLNLINYLKTIWKIWFDLIYESGGMKYFENIGAETEFEWLSNNPFDEIKKYDVFYWGMGKQYRPQIIDKCYESKNGNTPDLNLSQYMIRMSTTDLYTYIGNDDGTETNDEVSFWRAQQFTYKSNVYYPVGDIAIGPSKIGATTLKQRKVGNFDIASNIQGPTRQTIIVSGDVKGPINYELIWTNKNQRGNNFWIWRPIAPSDFIALGDVVTFTSNKPLTGENAPIRCVPLDITIRIEPNGKVLWSSFGSRVSGKVSLLGYVPNVSGKAINADTSNAYNLFRAVIGNNITIPKTDVNANFYRLDTTKYNSNFVIGLDTGNPDTSLSANRVGKGYLTSTKKDSKYSVMNYLNLKNNVILTHSMTKTKVEGQLIPNAISNAYLIKFNNKCLNYDNNTVSQNECDDFIDTQLFSIMMTGNKKNQCKIQHYNSKKYIKYKNNIFTLINEDDKNDIDYTLFIMS